MKTDQATEVSAEQRFSEYAAFISVDVEAAGPNPSQYSLLSIGACTLPEPRQTFYVELQPVNQAATEEASKVHGLSLEMLAESGLSPEDALLKFEAWLAEVVPQGLSPIFVALNAPFDWMFVNDYFHRYLGRNPFGFKALDINAFFMGLHGWDWGRVSMRTMSQHYQMERELTHHALQDAIDAAEAFRAMLEDAAARPSEV